MVGANVTISLSKRFWNQFDIGVEIDSYIYLFLQFPRCSFRYYLSTVEGDCLAGMDFFTEKKPQSCSSNTRYLHFKSWQSAGACILSRLAIKRLQNNVSARQNDVHGIRKTDRRTTFAHSFHPEPVIDKHVIAIVI